MRRSTYPVRSAAMGLIAAAATVVSGPATAAVQHATAAAQRAATQLPAPGADGTGWTAAVRPGASAGARTLEMVSPTGATSTTGPLASGQDIRHVSADAGRVMTDDQHTGADDLTAQVWDTRAATHRQVTVENSTRAAYTDNRILAVIGSDADEKCTLDAYDLAGARKHRTASFPCDYTTVPYTSADGSLVVVNSPDKARVWDTRTGKQVTNFKPPFPQNADLSLCWFSTPTGARTALLSCTRDGGDRNYSYRVNLATGKYVTYPYKQEQVAAQVSLGTVTHDAYGKQPWVLHTSGGGTTPIGLPAQAVITGTDGTVLYAEDDLKDENYDRKPGRLMTYDLRTGKLTYLTGTTSEQRITNALTVNRAQQR